MNADRRNPRLLVLLRHAESARQAAKQNRPFYPDEEARRPVAGTPDHLIPLTDLGRRQAAEAGLALRAKFGVFDRIYVSPYLRAQDTLHGILGAYSTSERRGIEVAEDLLLRERDTGYGHDMTEGEAAAAFPWLQAYWRSAGPLYAQPPGGESLAQVVVRVGQFYERLLREAADARVLIVAHGGSLRCLRFLIERWSPTEMERQLASEPMENCSATWYEPDPVSGTLVLGAANRMLTAVDGGEKEPNR